MSSTSTSTQPPTVPTVPPLSAPLLHRLKAAALVRALSLPPAMVRRLAGRPKRVDGNTLSPQTQLMLRLLPLSFEKPMTDVPLAEGRAAMRRQAFMVGGAQPVGAVEERTVRGAAGPLRARLYVPRSLVGVTERAPLLVFFHGGGMIYGDLDSHDAVCRFLAEQAEVKVLAVDYRLAPEAPFPAGVDDAAAAYRFVVENAAGYGADPDRLAVGGDSAGGYLAAATAIEAAREGLPLRFQLLVYPMTDLTGSFPSRQAFGTGFYLTTAFMDTATRLYADGADPADPRASVLNADLPDGLAPALVATAGFDPLRDEGEAYAEKLRGAGVPVQAERYAGEIHGFANALAVESSTSRLAVVHLAAALRRALHP